MFTGTEIYNRTFASVAKFTLEFCLLCFSKSIPYGFIKNSVVIVSNKPKRKMKFQFQKSSTEMQACPGLDC